MFANVNRNAVAETQSAVHHYDSRDGSSLDDQVIGRSVLISVGPARAPLRFETTPSFVFRGAMLHERDRIETRLTSCLSERGLGENCVMFWLCLQMRVWV